MATDPNLVYHSDPVPGKLATLPTKPCNTQEDLSKAYSPGVAQPCLEIAKNRDDVYKYTSKGNTIAVVSDGTAVLGLGNIGPEAGLPVMEGKCVLFKHFADIDAVPLCLQEVFGENGRTDAAKFITAAATLAPSFGGFNLEDIGSPACFEIEKVLDEKLNIPVFHDDQHGTAIISLAGVLNALKLVDKKIDEVKVVVSGAGAAGIACIEAYIAAGVKRENVVVCDSHGVVYKGRTVSMTPEKEKLAADTEARTLADALTGADVLLGLSVGGAVKPDMVKAMGTKPIIFAMANPTPEILPDEAIAAGAYVVGTGRTDFANQVNNVLGFPGIFRGALDVRASTITPAMKTAAAEALAELACEEIPESVKEILKVAYPEHYADGMFDGENPLKPTYVIPKPFDPRVVPRVARRVAEKAIEDGVNTISIDNFDAYEKAVFTRING